MSFILLAIIFVLYWGFAFATLYHLTRFGVGTLPKKIAAIFLMGSVVLFCANSLFFFFINLSVFNL